MEKMGDVVTAEAEPTFNYRGVKAMPFIIGIELSTLFLFHFVMIINKKVLIMYLHGLVIQGNETFEKLGTTGTSNNLLLYLTTIFHMKSITATTLINIFNGTTNVATLLGAFLSDTYFGRYKTLGFASISSFLVLIITFIMFLFVKEYHQHQKRMI